MPDEDDYALPSYDTLDDVQELTEERDPVCSRLIGAAGTGKTFTVKKAAKDDPEWGLLTSTTGISAVNLGAVTLNATLKYFNTQSMEDAFYQGFLKRILHGIAKRYRRLIVEEYSMLEAKQLQILYYAVREANRFKDVEDPLEIMLVGDLAQLPPVSGLWCFDAECWEKFAGNTTRLEHVWRQDGGLFLDALNHLRAGDGTAAVAALDGLGVKWHSARFSDFDGTTILPVNEQVSRYNEMALDTVKGKRIKVASRRWGQQRSEWGENKRTHEWGIPQVSEFKIGAYVMILANGADFEYANGDCGHIVSEIMAGDRVVGFTIRLVRNEAEVDIMPIVRGVEVIDKPEVGGGFEMISRSDDDGRYLAKPHYRGRVKRYVMGQIEYLPLRLAYASTVHKSQSLTLDRVQADFRHKFFGQPAMLYVALSRCRTIEGLTLVGDRDKFVAQCSMDRRVLPWL